MKILHFDFDDLESPLAGGQALRNFEINRRLVQKGHEITMVTLNYRGAENKIKAGIHYERISLKQSPLNFIPYFLAVPFVIRKHPFDLLVEDNIPPLTFGLSPLYTSKPVISQVQTFGGKFASQKYKLPFEYIEKVSAKLYKNFIVLTANMERKIHAINPKANIQIIPNGLNSLPDIGTKEKNYLLFLGRISFFTKGLDYLLEAMKILQRQNPAIELIIAGRGPDEDKLQTLIAQNKLLNTKYIGQIEGHYKDKLLAECLMLVLPSRHENFPLTILEAASYGKPSVCFDIENIQEIMAADIGLTVPAFDIKKYAQAIIQLMANPTERHHLGKTAHDWAKKHMWDTVAEEQEKFYQSCLSK